MTIKLNIEYENLALSNSRFINDLEAASSKVIRSGWYVLGKEVQAFEEEFASWVGAKYCIGVANGLDALILSIEALDLPQESEVLVASNTYIATILAIIRAGHKPVLVEPVLETFNIDPSNLKKSLTKNTRAICVTHLFGKTCRMDDICEFAKEYGLKIIEDCAQSHGAKLAGKMTGTFGDAGCFSFYPTKNLGAIGDGGAIVTDDSQIAEKLLHLRNYGSRQKYVNKYVGVNSRLDEIQAAMLRVKLKHLDEMILHKRNLAQIYFENVSDQFSLPIQRSDEYDVFHIFFIRHSKRDQLRQFLLEAGIKTEIHYPIPPHRQDAMKGILAGEYPIADQLHNTELSLPISFMHKENDIQTVSEYLNKFLETS
jgi:dTDP-4-amino-4,6-dideoxygalactose transaminase